jgi:CRP-like cAMP-binding protein
VFYIQKGKVKLTVVSKIGKEATIGILNEGDFFGEGCLRGLTRDCNPQDQSRSSSRDGGHNSPAGELFHEQVQEIGVH